MSVISKPISTAWYSRKDLWGLFLVVIFPLQLWAFVVTFLYGNALVVHTLFDWASVIAYALWFTMPDTLLAFGGLLFLGLLLPRRWEAKQRLAALIGIYLVVCGWALLGELTPFFLALFSTQLESLAGFAGWLTPLTILLVSLSAAFPIHRAGFTHYFPRWMSALAERISLLSMFYLCLDAVGLVILLIRMPR